MTAAGIDSAFEGSDHCPIWMDVELPQELPQGHPVPAMALQHHASGILSPHADTTVGDRPEWSLWLFSKVHALEFSYQGLKCLPQLLHIKAVSLLGWDMTTWQLPLRFKEVAGSFPHYTSRKLLYGHLGLFS